MFMVLNVLFIGMLILFLFLLFNQDVGNQFVLDLLKKFKMEGYVNFKIKVLKWFIYYICILLVYGFFYIKVIRVSLKYERN